MAKKVLVCEGKKVMLKHLKRGFIFSLYESQEFIGNFEVLEEMDKTETIKVKIVTPGIGERWIETKFTEDDLK